MTDELRRSTIQKQLSVKKISFNSETETFNTNISDEPPGGYK